MLRSPSVPITEDGGVRNDSTGESMVHKELGSEGRPDKLFNLFVRAISWPSEGRGLLHILSPLLYIKEFKIRAAHGKYYLCRDDSKMWLSQNEFEGEGEKQMIGSVETTPSGIVLDCSKHVSESGPCEIWEEVTKGAEGRSLVSGNVIRFGSYKVKVIDTVITDEALRQRSENSTTLKPFSMRGGNDQCDLQSEHTSTLSETTSTNGPVCRICFEPSDECLNILLSPCSCSGSLRYIHVECLRRWLDGQLQVKQFENGGGSYLIRTIHCEICKSVYSKSVYESILIPRPNVPHIILEDFITLQGPGNQPASKIHVVPIVKGKPIRIGRSKENDVVLADISVSRVHAMIQLGDHGIKLIDLSSKFGSLVQLPNTIFHPASGQCLRVQIGPGLLELTASFPSPLERIIPDRFLQERGIVKLVRSRSPNERIVEADRMRRSHSQINPTPTSPAATINNSFVRSPVSFREALLDDEDDHEPIDVSRST